MYEYHVCWVVNISMSVGRTRLTFQTLEYFSIDQPPRVKLRDADTQTGRYYFRLQVANHPGTLAAITAVLAKHRISISSVIQHESGQGEPQDPVPLVIMTHDATVGAAPTRSRKRCSRLGASSCSSRIAAPSWRNVRL